MPLAKGVEVTQNRLYTMFGTLFAIWFVLSCFMLSGAPKNSAWEDAPTPAPQAALKDLQSDPRTVLELKTTAGVLRIALRESSPQAAAFVTQVASRFPSCEGCTIYRAEPVPPYWGSKDHPDSTSGGRWGPPYALLQGTLGARGATMPSNVPREDASEVKRGMVAWAGGGAGPDFFVALADHPEWGNSHTVFADVLSEADMAVLEKIVSKPAKVVPGNPPVRNLAVPLPFSLTMRVGGTGGT